MAVRKMAYLLMFLLLTGCSMSPVEELFSIPELPMEYAEFNGQLNTIREQGAELTAPTGGFNRQSVQLMDLDNDSVDEGIVFAKEKNNEKNTFVYIFKKNGEEYQLHDKIQGEGNIVESVSYADVVGHGNHALIIGWGLEDNSARTLTVYEIAQQGMKKLMQAPYLYYAQADMDSDGVIDLNIVMPDEKNKAPELAMYTQGMGEFKNHSAVALSQGMGDIKKIRTGYAEDGLACVFIDSLYGENEMITDVIAYKGNRLVNVTRDENSGISQSTLRKSLVYCEDADGDGTIEVPYTEPLPGYENTLSTRMLNATVWRRCDSNGNLKETAFAYHDYQNEWHIVLPMKWRGKVTAERMNNNTGTMFYGISGSGEKKLLFSVYVLTGEQRFEKAQYSGRFQLTEKHNVIYAGTVKEKTYLGVDINEDSLREMFRWRETEWSSGEVVA